MARPSEPPTQPSAVPTEPQSQLYWIRDGEPIPIDNGGAIQITDELEVRITLDPYPPVGLSAQLELELSLLDTTGEPVSGAAVEVTYDMLSMVHGPFQPKTVEQDRGRYRTPLDLLMFGPWGLEIRITPLGHSLPGRLRIVILLDLPEP